MLPVLLAAALYVPPVQRWAVQTAARYASEATGMQISIGRLGISFPLDLDLNRLVVIDKCDTLVAVDQAIADLDFEHVFHWRIGVEALDLARGQVNIALRPDTTEKDTSKTQLPPLEVNIRRVALSDVRATFRTVGDTLSVFALLREATLSGGDIALGPSIYVVDRFEATVDSLSVSALDSLGQRSALFPPDLSPLSYPLTPFTVGLSRLSLTLEPLLRFSVGRFSLTTPSLCAALTAAGDLSAVAVDSLHVWLPDQVDLWGSGRASNLDRPDSLSARFDWDVHTRDLTPLARRLSIKDVALPPMDLNAFTSVEGSRCHIDAILNEGRGNVRLVGDYDTKDNSYEAQARINGLNVRDFLPRDSIGRLSASAKVQGRGTDPYDAATALAASLSLQSLAYGSWLIDNVEARASLRSHRATLDLQADNRLLKTDTKASAVVLKNSIRDARLDMQLERADLRALRLVEDTLSVAASLSATAATDFRERHSLAATLSDLGIETKDTVFHPLPLSVDARLTPDSIRARAEAGDLLLRFTSADGLKRLLAKVDNVNKYLKHQMDESMERHRPLQVDHDSLKTMLPTFDLNFLSGRDNTLFRIVQHLQYEFDEAALRLSSDPVRGINGEGHAYGITNGNVRLDTLQLHVDHDSKGFNLLSRLMNSRQNATGAFRALFSASLQPAAIETALEFYDAQGEKGIDLGLHIVGKDSALVGHITPQNPILAYRRFTVNPDNYIALDRKKHIRADFNLLADDGTQLMLFSPREQRDDVLQDLTLSVRRLNLDELCQVLPIVMPRVSGFLDGDIHALVVDTTEATVALGLEARDLVYEKAPLGTVGLDMVWMPNPDGTQVIDGQMTQNGREVLLLNGSYWKDRETKEDRIDATATLQRLPLLLANGFIPDNLITLAGYAVGHLSVTGPVSALSLNGALATDSMDIRSVPYSVHLALPRDTLHIDNSVIEMRNLRAFSVVDGKKGERPDLDVEHAMTLNGRVDCRDLNHIKLGLRVQAENFRLIDAPRNKKAQAYGKAYVDADVRLGGDLQKMRIGGKLRLLGKTDLTYVVTDTPLSADNKLDDLVTFVDFSDTTAVDAPVSNPMDIRLNLALAIDEAWRILARYRDVVDEAAYQSYAAAIDEAESEFTHRSESSLNTVAKIVGYADQLSVLGGEYMRQVKDVGNVEVDFTGLIRNPSFETKNTAGWTLTKPLNTSVAASTAAVVYPVSNLNYFTVGGEGSYVLHNSYNRLKEEGGFEKLGVGLSQQVDGLVPGIYRMTVGVGSDKGIQVTAFAGDASTTVTTDDFGKHYLSDAVVDNIRVEANTEGNCSLTIGIAPGDWYRADHFRLTYVGGLESQGGEDGIAETLAPSRTVIKGIYTLQGTRVARVTQPGIYIVDGKKVAVRNPQEVTAP